VGNPPDRALGRIVGEELAHQQHVAGRLEALRGLLAAATVEDLAPHTPRGKPLELEAFEDVDVLEIIRGLSASSTGDLLWMRPDLWQHPIAAELDEWVMHLMRSGRRSRAIYPARVLEEAPEMLRARAEAGEHVRILATVPTRLVVMGDSVALIPQRWGVYDDRRLVVRQDSIIRALTLLFESMWGMAVSVPGLEGQVGRGSRISPQRLLLNRLAAGDKDEQIARLLGLSLRTVRRRVAEILDELGVDSRFQAGVEAVRRGWV